MDTRTALKTGTLLRFSNHDHGVATYTIQKETGRGGSCIVYDAVYKNNAGNLKTVRIKECYPFKLRISRQDSGLLIPDDYDAAAFDECKKRMSYAFKINDKLFSTDGLTNSILNTLDIYEKNNTLYIVSAYLQGKTLSYGAVHSLKKCISIIKSTAVAIQRIHDRGYLYLDIKPQNIFVIDGTTEIVQLFDFDSIISINEMKQSNEKHSYRISYTEGFAALEQQMGQFRKFGKYTDVYGVGALLYYLLFEYAPGAPDCETEAAYDFSASRFAHYEYQDQLYPLLTEFFHNTLANYYADRYQDMKQVITKLEEIERYADTTVPYILSTRVNCPVVLTGRNDELEVLNAWFKQDKVNCLFLTGMGGIGKSTLIRKYLAENRYKFDTVLYLYDIGSIQRSITDDKQLCINTVRKREEETVTEYFYRKFRMIRELTSEKKVVLVIDNFDSEVDQDFSYILNANWKVVAVTRRNLFTQNFDTLNLKAISRREDLYRLFENYAQRKVLEEEYIYLDNIIEKIFGHTLVFELIARQVANSYLSIREASELADRHGFSKIAPEKVDYVKDQTMYCETIDHIVTALFDIGQMSCSQKIILKMLSLFIMPELDIHMFEQVLALDVKEDVNGLKRDGWVYMDGEMISIHPVLRESICHWEWTEEFKTKAFQVMEYIYKQLKQGGQGEEYQKILLNWSQSSQKCKKNNNWFRRQRKHFRSGKCLEDEKVIESICQNEDQTVVDDDKQYIFIRLAEVILEGCKNEIFFQKSKIYKELLYQTLIHMPRAMEAYILNHANELLEDLSWTNGMAVLNIYELIVTIYSENRDYEAAYAKIMEAETYVRMHPDAHVWGQYYFLYAGFYESRIKGAYRIENEQGDCILLIRVLNKAIYYMKRSRNPDSKQLLAKYNLFKAMVLMRGGIGKKKEIRKLLDSAKNMAEEYPHCYSEIRCGYFIGMTWYYTVVEPDFRAASTFMLEASESAMDESVMVNSLDFIDNIIVHCAYILMEWKIYDKSAAMISNGLQICENYEVIIPYKRKKMELYGCLLEIYFNAGDLMKCREIVSVINRENETAKEYGIAKEIPAELKEIILQE